ncbi:transcriptional regulator [Methylopila jiangsuensis]|uniref:Transcriptional regulator n=1 Tax=Methylopila jiangsuensis TaxID=586230 RepID=A0A9W6JLS1_9HYPH|nr:XRE family transcriptional regulator [Methylopila jiangsuensis]MDR6284563.1 HTH-type transcriptional regulator/antitoxin HigA [Methylopila jiangsuensis]GLK78049.1 transcriptional regulator [Methylopila jiangsuensis]
MDIRPIRTEADYDWALAEVERYFDEPPAIGSPEGDRFDVLSTLIASYEAERFPLPDLDPIEALKAFMESAGKTQADLAELFGSKSRASEVLNRKRALTLNMVYRLRADWGLPSDLVARPYDLRAA